MKKIVVVLEGDVVCCDIPPHTCPRRYCSLAFRSFAENIGKLETGRNNFGKDTKSRKAKGRSKDKTVPKMSKTNGVGKSR